MKKLENASRGEKDRQVRKEARATMWLFLICMIWSIVTAIVIPHDNSVLSGKDVFFHLPAWWWLSVPCMWVIAVIGVVVLLKFIFVDFDLDDDVPEDAGDGMQSMAGGEADE